MARKRMIDPDFWSDEKLGLCNRDERLLFMGLISNADDEGRGRANFKLIKSTIFPYDEDLSSEDIQKMLLSLSKLKLVIFYEVDSQEFYFLPNFLKHQNINRPTPSKLPVPTDDGIQCKFIEESLNNQGVLTPKRKEKKLIEDHSVNDQNVFFDSLWKLYPNKKGKGKVSDSDKKILYELGNEQIEQCIERYKKSKPEWCQWQNGSTFFHSGYKDYLDENYTETKSGLSERDEPMKAW